MAKNSSETNHLHKHDCAVTVFLTQMSGLINTAQDCSVAFINTQDIECLHEYRLTLRHAEALVFAFRDVLPEPQLLQMRTEIKALFAASGQLRDLDLLLDKFQSASSTKDISPTIELLKEISLKRQHEFEQFLQTSQNLAFSQRFLRLRLCLSKVEQCGIQVSLYDCWPILLKKSMDDVHTAYKRLWQQKNERHIHKLRKMLKRLRYCVELLGVLIKPRKAKPLLLWLKNQQESLGNYNDYKVQLTLLKGYGQAKKKIGPMLFSGDLAHCRQTLPLSKADWKILKKKSQPLLGYN